MDEDVYASKSYLPRLVTEGKVMNWRGINNFMFSVCPFVYYPTDGKLCVLTDFVIEVNFVPISLAKKPGWQGSGDNVEDILHLFANEFEPLPQKEDNSHGIKSSSDDYDLLIIVGNLPTVINSQELQNFRLWKSLKGYKNKLVSTVTIGSTPEDIKSYIAQEYDSCNIKYVLFIGDTDEIPLKMSLAWDGDHYVNYYTYSDYWYGCLNDGVDEQAEVPIGRFPSNDLSELRNMINKTIKYESTAIQYANHSLIIADGGSDIDPQHFQLVCDTVRRAYDDYMSFSLAYGAPVNEGGNAARNSDVINYINNGVNIVNYHGHSGTYDWGPWNRASEFFGYDKVDEMCDSVYAVFLANACMSGNIDDYSTGGNRCILESFLSAPNGAVAYMGSSDDAFDDCGKLYALAFFGELLTGNTYTIGNLHLAGELDMNAHYQSYQNAFNNILGSDPTLEIWNDVPSKMSLLNVEVTSNSINVYSALVYATVSIVSENGELIEKKYPSGSNSTFNKPLGNFYVSINHHGYLPYIAYYDVTSNTIQNVTFDNYVYNYSGSPLSIGYDVTTEKPFGNVVVKDGSKLNVKLGSGGVLIKNSFTVEKGGEFRIE